ncbi:Concanavalin A-like lectin/glucanases superfamily [Pyrinomonas methylaliphatogenes]|uniref:Concanavalin A-like lectin/glucanases superfamily n=2 Tax=Pyrinomonas methylaliphatogenes TaxID=454194 RepID=A0A0B6WYY9_9BACT|nr:Concanavalin A-like lectin/glucanases superfamily [Pyrinomonas methylaliphatogenes]
MESLTPSAQSSRHRRRALGAALSLAKFIVCLMIGTAIARSQIINPNPVPLPCMRVPPGIVAWWPMDDPAGSAVLKDIIGGHNAAPVKSPVGAAQAPQPTAGKVGGAINFAKYSGSGYSGAIVANISGPLALVGSADLSIDAWIKFPPTSAPGGRHYIINKYDAPNKKGYALYIVRPPSSSSSYLEFLWGDGNNVSTVQSSASITPNQWHLVAVTFARNVGGNALVVRLYVDGAQQGMQTSNVSNLGSLANAIAMMIGYQPSSADEPITIDELEIFNRALTAQEVQHLYSFGSAGKCRFNVVNPNPNTNPN